MSDFQEAIQSPRSCFSDLSLKAGTPALNPLGLPQPVTGGFASVYQVVRGPARWAVRCFLHCIPDLQERYALISRALQQKPLRSTVEFEYLREGIRIRGSWYPVLKMEWVDGDTLNVHVRKSLKNPRALSQLAQRWAALVESLERADIAHGDLQHGNVLVRGGEFKLIDYDGMFVPALKGRHSHEKGHPAYQHPQRTGRDFDARIDRFSALVIYVSLLAVATEPRLFERFHDDDNLLFRRADFASPRTSPVLLALEGLGDPQVATLARAVREACLGSLRDVPRLVDACAAPAKAAPQKAPKHAPVPALVTAGVPPPSPPVPLSGRPSGTPQESARWKVCWVRPGSFLERHIYKEPVYGVREEPRRFLGIPMGKRRVKFIEGYRDRIKEHHSTVDGHRSTVTALAFSPDGSTLASGSADRTLRIWSVGSGREASMPLQTGSGIRALALFPGRGALVAALDVPNLVLWDFGLQRQIIHLETPDGSRIAAVAVSADGRFVAAGGRGRSVFVWDAVRGALVGNLQNLKGAVCALAFTPDGADLVYATRNGWLERVPRGSANRAWSVRTGLGPLETLRVASRASSVLGGSESGLVISWDLRDGREIWTADPGAGSVRSFALSPDGAFGALGLNDRTARITRLATRSEVGRLEGHAGPVTAVAFSATQKGVATGSSDGSVRVWQSP
jgi:WD40 repeat protein